MLLQRSILFRIEPAPRLLLTGESYHNGATVWPLTFEDGHILIDRNDHPLVLLEDLVESVLVQVILLAVIYIDLGNDINAHEKIIP